MEIKALIEGIKICLAKPVVIGETVKLLVDSKYVFDGVDVYLDKWNNNGWRLYSGKPVKNQELWAELLHFRNKLIDAYGGYAMYHVNSHTANTDKHSTMNAFIDQMATNARLQKKDLHDYCKPEDL